MDIWLLYLMTRTEAIGTGFGILGTIGLIAGCLGYIFSHTMAHDKWETEECKKGAAAFKPTAKRIALASLAALFIGGLMPSSKDWYLIIGGYYVTNIEGIGDLPKNTVGAMNEFLKQYKPDEKADKAGERT